MARVANARCYSVMWRPPEVNNKHAIRLCSTVSIASRASRIVTQWEFDGGSHTITVRWSTILENAYRCRRRHRLSNIRMSACKPSPIFVVEYIVSCAPVVLFFYYCHEKTFHLINALGIFKVKCMQPLLLIYRWRSIFFFVFEAFRCNSEINHAKLHLQFWVNAEEICW